MTLPDGNRVLVLLNDTVLEIPESGTIQLPAATWNWLIMEDREKTKELGNKFGVKLDSSNDIHCLDAASCWISCNREIEASHEERTKLWVCLLIAGALGLVAIFGIVFVLSIKE